MIALYIILGILLLLFLILLIKIEVLATYTQELTLTLKILFVRTTLIPPPEKKEKKKPEKKKPEPKKEEKPKKEKEKKPSYLEKLKKKKGLSGIVSLFVSIARIALGMLKGIFSHIVIKKLDVGIALSGEDSSSVALNYGKLCSAIYPAINIITAATVCKDYNVAIEPAFYSDNETEIYADVHAYLRPIWVLAEAIKAAVKIVIARIKL